MKIEEDTGVITFDDVAEILTYSSNAINRTNSEIDINSETNDERAKISALHRKALYMAVKIPEFVKEFEAKNNTVPLEVKEVVKRLSVVALESHIIGDWETIRQLPKTSARKDLPADVIEQLAIKYK